MSCEGAWQVADPSGFDLGEIFCFDPKGHYLVELNSGAVISQNKCAEFLLTGSVYLIDAKNSYLVASDCFVLLVNLHSV
jgi:hypothetical protein